MPELYRLKYAYIVKIRIIIVESASESCIAEDEVSAGYFNGIDLTAEKSKCQ